jgi:hypothetical protein
VSVDSHTHTMGKKTVLHTAAEEGKSEELQQLLDTGEYDVNQGSDEEFHKGVCRRERESEKLYLIRENEREKERKREREKEKVCFVCVFLISMCLM